MQSRIFSNLASQISGSFMQLQNYKTEQANERLQVLETQNTNYQNLREQLINKQQELLKSRETLSTRQDRYTNTREYNKIGENIKILDKIEKGGDLNG